MPKDKVWGEVNLYAAAKGDVISGDKHQRVNAMDIVGKVETVSQRLLRIKREMPNERTANEGEEGITAKKEYCTKLENHLEDLILAHQQYVLQNSSEIHVKEFICIMRHLGSFLKEIIREKSELDNTLELENLDDYNGNEDIINQFWKPLEKLCKKLRFGVKESRKKGFGIKKKKKVALPPVDEFASQCFDIYVDLCKFVIENDLEEIMVDDIADAIYKKKAKKKQIGVKKKKRKVKRKNKINSLTSRFENH